jgi:hypothetical protein
MSTRTDIHSPVNMDPASYTYLIAIDPMDEFFFAGWSEADKQEFFAWERALSPLSRFGRCTHCGAHIRYHAMLRHDPTGETIYVGETCLDNRFSLESKAQFDALRKAAELDRKAQRLVKAAAECLSSLDLTPATAEFLANRKGTEGHYIALDIRSKLYKYGSISQKQADLVAKLIDQMARRAAEQAERDANATMPIEGRVQVTGTVVSTKWVENDFGGSLKMLVDVGTYRLWGSVPSKISVERGDQVSFMAQVTAKEIGFGFYSRPTQAKVTAQAAA